MQKPFKKGESPSQSKGNVSLFRYRRGFTLVEILITVVIIAVLAVLIVPRMIGRVQKAQEAEAVNNLGAIRSAELLLHGLTGKFAAAADHPAILSALGLLIDGRFYSYKIIDASEEDFLALATPLGPLENWLYEFGINKDGFVGYNPYSGGGSGGGGSRGGGSGGGSSGGGSSGGGLGGGSSGGSSGGGMIISGGGGTTVTVPGTPQITETGPPFAGYAADIQAVLDTLTLSTFALSSPLMQTGAHLSQWLPNHTIDVQFGDAGAGAWGVTKWNSTLHLPYIILNTELQANKYAAAEILAHETLHAHWLIDDYLHITTGAPYQYGVPNPLWDDNRTSAFGINGHDTIDQEYNAFITGSQVWMDLKSHYDVGDDQNLWVRVNSQASYFVESDGTLKDEDLAKQKVRQWYNPPGTTLVKMMPEY